MDAHSKGDPRTLGENRSLEMASQSPGQSPSQRGEGESIPSWPSLAVLNGNGRYRNIKTTTHPNGAILLPGDKYGKVLEVGR